MSSSIEKAMDRKPIKGASSGASMPQESGSRPMASKASDDKIHRIALSRLEQDGLLIPERGGNELAEEYRMIKRPLLMNAFGKGAAPVHHGNLVMVVSALSGEGKTFTTLNLSMSIAMERDTTVLMVDSDVLKSTLSQALGLSGRIGLTDLLQDPTLSVGDAIVNTDIPKLKILPSGNINIHSTELLASRRMEQVASELSNRYPDRIVLFDSPPLLITSQACVLSQQMGQILLVVEAGRTSQTAVKEAIGLLSTEKVIGLVLNKKPGAIFSSHYKPYGYGYEYGPGMRSKSNQEVLGD